MKTTRQKILEQQSLNRKIWAKDNGRMHRIDANKLIAEFMGIVYPKLDDVIVIDNVVIKENELQYHTSWDWLMPVIQKCLIGEAEHSEDVSNLAIKNIYESICNQDISLAHKSVVKFINQYNKTK